MRPKIVRRREFPWFFLAPALQGAAFIIMGLYFWYDAETQFGEAGPGPALAVVGSLELMFIAYAWWTDL